MFNIRLERLNEEIEKSLPETVRILRAFYFEKLSKEGGEGEDVNGNRNSR